MSTLTIEEVKELVGRLAPQEYKSILIENAIAPQCFNYCYIIADVQRVKYKNKNIDAALDDTLKQKLEVIIGDSDANPYVVIDDRLVEQMKNSSIEGFFSSAKNKIGEMIGEGRAVEHGDIALRMDGDCLAKEQNIYAVKAECKVVPCAHCEGKGEVMVTDKDGNQQYVTCKKCNGRGQVGTLACFTPSVSGERTSMVYCLEGDIDGLQFNAKDTQISVSGCDFSLEADVPVLMVRHINGIDEENIPADLQPYMEMVRKKVGNDNAMEKYAYRIIPCFVFKYREVLTGAMQTGVVISPFDNPQVILNLAKLSEKVFDGMRNKVKSLGRILGGIRRSDSFKDAEDLKHTLRLLIAVVVADGQVREDEKRVLMLTLHDTDRLTAGELDSLARLLGEPNADFVEDDDFEFNDRANATETIARMEEIATVDGAIHDKERELIERLKSKY